MFPILDGWWAEAYTPRVGWAIGDGKEHGDDPAWDASDADALYVCWSVRSLLSFIRAMSMEFRNAGWAGCGIAWRN